MKNRDYQGDKDIIMMPKQLKFKACVDAFELCDFTNDNVNKSDIETIVIDGTGKHLIFYWA